MMEMSYRMWFLLYPGRQGDDMCIKDVYGGKLPSPSRIRECYRRFKYHSDNWRAQTMHYMKLKL